MLAQQIGQLIKTHRQAVGLTQGDLARRSEVSRTTLSRLEQGKAPHVQADVLDRLLDALDLRPRIEPSATASQERRLARLEQDARLRVRREQHLRLMLDLLTAPLSAPEKIQRARDMVALWRENRTCSAYFIQRWQTLLDMPAPQLAQAMGALGEWEDALFQNTPWSWAWSSKP